VDIGEVGGEIYTRVAVVCILSEGIFSFGDVERSFGDDLVEGEGSARELFARVAMAGETRQPKS
jgi:hypothetical protein